ncbi:MAG: phosphoglycerate mutase family protein [bacterium]|nr:phosphoglycerate mutase family protein [bacterium]
MIYFIRHGESEANEKGVLARDNVHLTKKGRMQVEEAAGEILKENIKFDHIIVSPLTRTKETAIIIVDKIGFDQKKIEYDKRIAEYEVGEMADKPEKGTTSAKLISTKGAEDPYKFKDRIKSFLNQYKNSKKNILMVSHAGVGRMIGVINKHQNPKIFYDLPKWPNATLIKLK